MQDSGRVRQFINRHNIKIACCFSIVALVSNLIVMKRHKKENGLKPVEKEDVRSGMVYTKGMERFREDFIDLKNLVRDKLLICRFWLTKCDYDFSSLLYVRKSL